nr:efflux RND transporter periplasmic adaptor subunit [Chloroflexota bacterium]
MLRSACSVLRVACSVLRAACLVMAGFLFVWAVALIVPSSGRTQAKNTLEVSGVIEADEVRIASEFQGTVVQVGVQAGEAVRVGQMLVVLDSQSIQATVRQAEAAVKAAQADLGLIWNKPQAEEVSIKQAQVTMAKAQRDEAYVAWQAAQRELEELQELQKQILEARAQLALAEQNVEQAKANYYRARYKADHAEWGSTERQVLELQAKAAEAALAAAQADERAAKAVVQHLEDMQQRPLAYRAKTNAAKGKYHVAEAAMAVGQAELDDLLAGATAEEVAVAEANLALAQAQLRLAQMQLERLTLRAPVNGVVVARMINVGETVLPGVTLLTLADLDEVNLVVYVPEHRLGEVHLGQKVDVMVDSFPQRRFEGRVVYISDQPQYTPRNVATKEERVNTVYAVKVRLPNPEGLIKPGMAGDAVFGLTP